MSRGNVSAILCGKAGKKRKRGHIVQICEKPWKEKSFTCIHISVILGTANRQAIDFLCRIFCVRTIKVDNAGKSE